MREFLNKPIKDTLLSNLVFKAVTVAGWKYQVPHEKMTCVYVAYPHTSNWDTILGLCASIIWDNKLFVLVKEDYDKPVLRDIMKFFRMLPIKRSLDGAKSTEEYYRKMGCSITIAVEGTRKKSNGWKKGFYWFAKNNNIPIILGHYNYEEKIFGWDAIIEPTGTYDEILEKCKVIYEKTKPVGKYPEFASPIKWT